MNILKAAGEFLASVADAIAKMTAESEDGIEAAEVDFAAESMQNDALSEDEEEALVPTQAIRATIKAARREMDPVTLQGWSRVIFTCEDGVERKMYFSGENGVYLTAGETGVLEHRDGSFVCFEKDSGEIVGALYHILPEEE